MALVAAGCPLAAQPAFPGAEGAGAATTGGRGGIVVAVTNLNDSGTGSLRAALAVSGRRTIVFRVSGTINLVTPISVSRGDVTIAGQTAPGDGICIARRNFTINADNVILRFLRFRLGDTLSAEEDSLNIATGRSRVIVDHCSVSWSVDECFSSYDTADTTVQWTLISESLNDSVHSKGRHGYGGIWGGKTVSFHHNLFAHHYSRTPRFNGARTDSRPEWVDYRNNVIYNWGINGPHAGEESMGTNVVNNWYRYGPATQVSRRFRVLEPTEAVARWYVAGNYMWGSETITADNWAGGVQGSFATLPAIRSLVEFPIAPYRPQSATEAYDQVLRYVGAMLPRRDSVDARVLEDVRLGRAQFGPGALGLINSQTEVGGWPVLNSAPAPADTDGDGMPDAWETANGLNPASAADGPLVGDARGYTNLELYLNALASWAMPPEYRDPDRLAIAIEGSTLRATWSPRLGALQLESADSPAATSWTSHGSGNGLGLVVPAPADAPARFFRLARP